MRGCADAFVSFLNFGFAFYNCKTWVRRVWLGSPIFLQVTFKLSTVIRFRGCLRWRAVFEFNHSVCRDNALSRNYR